MSEEEDAREASEPEIVSIDVRAWVEAARDNPDRYRDRQVTEIVLAAIGLSPSLKENLVLKGGAVMALAFKSNRVTGDVDFTAIAEPAGFSDTIAEELNERLPRTAIRIGYPQLLCRVQSVRKMPRPVNFEEYDFPALRLRIASAARGTNEERRLQQGKATRVVDMEVSFRDQVYAFQELLLDGPGIAVRAFSLHELIAEKLRALLQQPHRNRNRRQDVYDIAFLIEANDIDASDKALIYETLLKKCKSHGIDPKADSMDDPEVRQRAQKEWHTLGLELGDDLPDFDERFELMQSLYVSLPW